MSSLSQIWKKKWKTTAGLATVLGSYLLKRVAAKYSVPDDVVSQTIPYVLDWVGLGGGALAVYGVKYRSDSNHEETKALMEELKEENRRLGEEIKSLAVARKPSRVGKKE